MSYEKETFLINGYDLSDKIGNCSLWSILDYDDDDVYDTITNGDIRFVDDPMSAAFLFFGEILACTDESKDIVTKVPYKDFSDVNVFNKLKEYNNKYNLGISLEGLEQQIIMFDRWT